MPSSTSEISKVVNTSNVPENQNNNPILQINNRFVNNKMHFCEKKFHTPFILAFMRPGGPYGKTLTYPELNAIIKRTLLQNVGGFNGQCAQL